MNDTAEIRQHLWKAMASSPFVMVERMGAHDHAQPMTAQLDEDADSAFWFYTRRDNRLAPGGEAMVQFVAKGHDLFACIAGRLVEETDPAVIDRHWSNMVAAWFEGGRDDPALLMLRFEIDDAEIWESDASLKGMFKLMTGAKVAPGEVGRHVETAL